MGKKPDVKEVKEVFEKAKKASAELRRVFNSYLDQMENIAQDAEKATDETFKKAYMILYLTAFHELHTWMES